MLATLWCKSVGDKKSELFDALSRQNLDRATVARLKALDLGIVPERTIREAERALESDVILVKSASRTLRSWDVAESDIKEVLEEAERFKTPDLPANVHLELTWAQVDLVSPIDGIILEKNVTVGEVVDQTDDLFRIGDIARLQAVAHVYEEELPLLMSLGAEERRWRVSLLAQPDTVLVTSSFELPSHVIDPAQHTAQVLGWVENADDKLVAGQFISATVEIPTRTVDVVIPTSAVFDEGKNSYVLVVVDEARGEFEQRAVAVTGRSRESVRVKSSPTDDERRQGIEPLPIGQRVLSSGISLILAAMKN